MTSWLSRKGPQSLWKAFRVRVREDVWAVRRYATQSVVDPGSAAVAALVVTELGTNLVKHARGGRILQGPSPDGRSWDVVAIDEGPGIRDLTASLRDHYSTAGSAGLGLGGIERSARAWTIRSGPDGTRIFARVGPPDGHPLVGARLAFRQAPVSGDCWLVRPTPAGARIALFDGSGHGEAAFLAARTACEVVERHPLTALERVLRSVHEAVEPLSRAVTGAIVDVTPRRIRSVHVGSCTLALARADGVERWPARNGELGRGPLVPELRRTTEWSGGDILLLATDGFSIPEPDGLDAPGWLADTLAGPGLLRDDACLLALTADSVSRLRSR